MSMINDTTDSVLKRCCTCHEFLQIVFFHKSKNRKDGLSLRCKICTKQKSKKRTEYNKIYRANNKEKLKNNNRNYYIKIKDDRRVERKKEYSENKEKHAVMAHIYYEKHKDKIKSRIKSYNETVYKNQRILNSRKRKAIKAKVTVEHFKHDEIIKKYGSKCFYCNDGEFEHIDHYIPLSKGGSHSLENIRPSCAKCNMCKSDKMPEEFYTFIDMLGKALVL